MRSLKTMLWRAIMPLFCVFGPAAALCAPVSSDTAAKAVQGWLQQDRHPLGARLSGKINRTEAVNDNNGNTLFYVVHLKPAGYVVLSADDTLDPVIAFSATGTFKNTAQNIVPSLVNHDISGRLIASRSKSSLKACAKWRAFVAGAGGPPPDTAENGDIVTTSDLRVAPIIQTLWNQSSDISEQVACYNYFTPPFGPGNTNNYPCGCVATAMAQLMYHFQYPIASVGPTSFGFTVDGHATNGRLRGGDGLGGPYQWTNMPLAPNLPSTNQAIAVGSLTYDAGISINMSYTANNSTAATETMQSSLMTNFMYGNVSYFENDNGTLAGTNLLDMLNPNLDAKLPVILGIQVTGDTNSGHCVLADGYGYSVGTLFHHLNAGWGGDNDIWYNLPTISILDSNIVGSVGTFNSVFSCAYNIYTNGTGHIVSGRVTDPTGNAITGATVTAAGGGNTYTTTTDTNGIFALTHLPAPVTYTVAASNASDVNLTQPLTCITGNSTITNPNSGNVWGANFILSPPLLIIPSYGFASVGPSNGPFNTTASYYTLSNASTSPIAWSLATTAPWLSLNATNGVTAASAVSTFEVSLATNSANRLLPGNYSGFVWVTNLSNNFIQELTFALSVEAGDYPISVSGFNMDVIVESNAVGGNTINYADGFDPSCLLLGNSPPACFYGAGLIASNVYGGMAISGLPSGGLITSEADGQTVFQLAPYENNNVLYLTAAVPSNSLIFNNANESYKSLSILAASTQGGGNGTLVIHFADGSSSSNISFSAPNYLVTNSAGPNAALTNFGILVTGGYNQYYTADGNEFFPSLFQTKIDLQSRGMANNPISSVSFTMPAATNSGMATGVFALSGTQSVFTGNYSLTLAASPAAGGTVSGGGSFEANSTQTVTATPNLGYIFVNWTEGGTLLSTSNSFQVTLASNMTLTANFAPVYMVSVSNSPPAGGTVTGGGSFASGESATLTAVPNAGYQFVAWSGAATGTSNTVTISVTTSLTVVANYAAIGSNATLTIITNGAGKVTHIANPQLGHSYSLMATASNTYIFAGWTGSITTNKSPLSFKFLSNTVLQANFIPNPFISGKGAYNGLFYLTNGEGGDVSEATAGILKNLMLGTKGMYSGSLLVNGVSHGISGTFTPQGNGTSLIKRPASQGDLLVNMELVTSNAAPQIIGTVTGTNADGVWRAPLIADRATNVVPSAEFTMLVPPVSGSESPAGYGYASITNHNGNAVISGKLADGTSLNQSVPVSADGFVPFYQNLYSGAGLVLGWLNLDLTNNSRAGLTWIHPTTRHGSYTNGFTNFIASGPLLSPWTNSIAGVSGLTNLLVNGTQNIGITVSNNFKFGGVSGSAPVSGTINKTTGAFTMTIGKGREVTNGFGAILQSPLQGGGYYIVTNTSRSLQLQP